MFDFAWPVYPCHIRGECRVARYTFLSSFVVLNGMNGSDRWCVAGRFRGSENATVLNFCWTGSRGKAAAVRSRIVLWLVVLSILYSWAGSSSWAKTAWGKSATVKKGADARLLMVAKADRKDGEPFDVKLHDLELIDQDEQRVKFKSDVIGDRVAVIIPFYTSCTTSYPVLIFMFTRLQDMLGDRLGKDVVLVSVTVDPRTDSPVRLKAYAGRQNAKPGWVFLTGDRNHLGRVLLGAGALFSSNVDEHNHIPVTLVGRDGGEWRRLHGFPRPEQVLDRIEGLLADGTARGEVES